jgi:uncharacterized protein YndB with AHSA1/START domain
MCNHQLHIESGGTAVTADAIEREILIDATPEEVWPVITEPDQIRLWFTEEVDLEARPGANGSFRFRQPGGGDTMTFYLQVQAVEPPRRFAFRWMHPAGSEPTPANAMLVEFTLTPAGDCTRLRVIESGLAAIEWDEQRKGRLADEHGGGWEGFLIRLRDLVTEREGAAAA